MVRQAGQLLGACAWYVTGERLLCYSIPEELRAMQTTAFLIQNTAALIEMSAELLKRQQQQQPRGFKLAYGSSHDRSCTHTCRLWCTQEHSW